MTAKTPSPTNTDSLEAKLLLDNLREAARIQEEARIKLGELIVEARAKGIRVKAIQKATRLSPAWINRVATTGKWPSRKSGKTPSAGEASAD